MLKLVLVVCSLMRVGHCFSFDDPCNIVPNYDAERIPSANNDTSAVHVPQTCTNGTFYWPYPSGHVIVHYSNPDEEHMAVCFRNYVGGDIFNITDITDGAKSFVTFEENYNLEIDEIPSLDKWTCTESTTAKDLVFKVDAPETLYYVGAVEYEIRLTEERLK